MAIYWLKHVAGGYILAQTRSWLFLIKVEVVFGLSNNNNNNNNNIIIIIIITITETTQGGKVTILWNQQAQTDRTVPNNKPDIIIRDNEKGTCMLINVANSGDRNVIKKGAERILKYKYLIIEIQRIWNVKT